MKMKEEQEQEQEEEQEEQEEEEEEEEEESVRVIKVADFGPPTALATWRHLVRRSEERFCAASPFSNNSSN